MVDVPRTDKHRTTWLDILLATLVALYGVTTAAAAYFSGVTDGDANQAYFTAIRYTDDANNSYLTAQIDVAEDFRLLDEIAVQEATGASQELLNYLYTGYTAPAQDALDRSGYFDEIYFDEMYEVYFSSVDSASVQIDLAEQLDDISDSFQLVVLILAVGLSFVAWASLGEDVHTTRVLFVIMSLLIYISGTFFFARVFFGQYQAML